MNDKQAVDQTVIAKNINDNDIRDGEMMMRTVGDDRSFTTCGIVTGNVTNKQEGFAAAMKLSCEIVDNGMDVKFGCSMRTGANKRGATQALMQKHEPYYHLGMVEYYL